MERPYYREALRRVGVMRTLAEFDPHLTGTLPLGLDLPTSDLDILCHAAEPDVFVVSLWAAFSGETDFSLRQWIVPDRPAIASFTANGWPFQVFGQEKPVREQNGWRHFIVERRLLRLGGPTFRAAIMRERSRGAKTEPAFATVLRLTGDPYVALLGLERCDNGGLNHLLVRAGFGGNLPSTDHYPSLTILSARYQTSDFIH
jgi:hypothetical protein